MKYKVVHYIESREFGGAEEMLFNLLGTLDRNKWEPVLLYHPYPGITAFIEKVSKLKIELVSVPQIKSWRDITGLIKFIKQIKQIRPTIFHAHITWNLQCSYGIISAYFAGVSVIVATQHLYQEIQAQRIYKLYILRIYQKLISIFVDRYIAVSYNQATHLKKVAISEDKVEVVQNGIYVEKFSKKADCHSLNLPLNSNNKMPIILTVARLDRLKGHKYLLAAACLVPNAIFVLAGEGPERKNLEDQARTLDIIDRVLFLGQRNDIPELLNACDVFVLPSVLEGLPLSVLEAMAASKPVIATNIPGINEIIIDGENGLLVSPADPNALAEKINLILSNASLAHNLAVSGMDRVSSEFSAKKMVDGVTNIYEELIRQRSGLSKS